MNILSLISITYFISSAHALSNRIIGGEEITIEEAPYQIALYYDSKFTCGGSILSRTFALTAAHCVYCYVCIKKKYSIRVGTDQYDFDDPSGVTIGISKIIIHPDYNDCNSDYDFALLKLKKIKAFPEVVRFAVLPTLNDVLNDSEDFYVTGWGATEDSNSPDTLQRAIVPIVNLQECQESYAYINKSITDRMICAGFDAGKIDSCHGDSGGPLVRVSDGIQFGVTSFGYKCALPDYPGVYSRISKVLNWIYSNANLKRS